MHRNISVIVLIPLFFCGVAEAQLIVAHRGASFDAPENTLSAFRLAWEQQADAIEADFYLTKDRKIVCIHDKTTERVAPNQPVLSVAESTLEELSSLDVGRWKHPRFAKERIPTLREVLDTVPGGKRIFVEIKCGPEILPILKTQLAASRLTSDQIVIIGFNKEVVSESRRMMPQHKANWLTNYKQATKQSVWKPARAEVISFLKSTGATGLGSHGNLEVIDQDFVKAVRNAACEFHVWTVNSAEAARIVQTLGVDSITTDRPEYIQNVLRSDAR